MRSSTKITAEEIFRERLQAIIDWADLAMNNREEFDSHGVRNLDGPVFDAAREALAKSPSPPQQQIVTVRPLKWRQGYCDDQVTISQATTLGGIYQIRILNGEVWLDKPDTVPMTTYSTAEEAKIAAQADHEARMRAELELLSPFDHVDAEPTNGVEFNDDRSRPSPSVPRLNAAYGTDRAWRDAHAEIGQRSCVPDDLDERKTGLRSGSLDSDSISSSSGSSRADLSVNLSSSLPPVHDVAGGDDPFQDLIDKVEVLSDWHAETERPAPELVVEPTGNSALASPDNSYGTPSRDTADYKNAGRAETPTEARSPLGNAQAQTDPGSLEDYFERQIAWSRETFGPARRTKGIIEHIGKELSEIERKPHDLSEWVDVITMAMDGFWRHGGTPAGFLPALLANQRKNIARVWPDWCSMSEDSAIEHDRSQDVSVAPEVE